MLLFGKLPKEYGFMKELVCFTVEGLLRQGPHQVWVTLGAYKTAEQAEAAQRSAPADNITETRVLPYYRGSSAAHCPHFSTASRSAKSTNSWHASESAIVA